MSSCAGPPDVIGSVSMHPFEPTLLSALGSRQSLARDYRAFERSTPYSASDSEDDLAASDDGTSSSHSFTETKNNPALNFGLINLSEGRHVETSGIVPS